MSDNHNRRIPQVAGSTGHGEKLSRGAERAIAALLTQPTMEAAAKSAGVSDRTLRNWLKRPAFQTAYREARGELLTRAIGLLASGAGKGAALLTLMTCSNDAPAAVRVSAAAKLLEFAFRGAELADLAERLDTIEQRLAAGDAKWPAAPLGRIG